MSFTVYGGFTAVLWARLQRAAAACRSAAPCHWWIGIGVSRVILHRHSPIEVVVGLAIGSAALAFIVAIVRRHPSSHLPLRSLG